MHFMYLPTLILLHILITGLQITVGHWTLSDQNLLVPNEFSAVVGSGVWAIFFVIAPFIYCCCTHFLLPAIFLVVKLIFVLTK